MAKLELLIHNKNGNTDAHVFTKEQAHSVARFHRTIPGYSPTPLVALSNLASSLNVGAFYVKDESKRFDLNAFKVLGGSYCACQVLAEKLQGELSQMSFKDFLLYKQALGDVTFVTATDGNHGRGIAWTANKLRQKAVVYMPSGSSQERLENIRALGANADIVPYNYDGAVALAAKHAQEYDWTFVQDTAWEGYEKIPTWIMQGYMTMGLEAVQQLGDVRPTHIFLQAGVGAMAGALAAFFSDYYRDDPPVITVVEPNIADCVFRTAQTGRLHTIEGDLPTIMAGLACGTPCSVGWEMLDRFASAFVRMDDCVAAKGMRVLGAPMGSDPRVIAGESGAAGVGCAVEILQNETFSQYKRTLGLDAHSRILCISTEGDTDRAMYQKIVHEGLYPSFD